MVAIVERLVLAGLAVAIGYKLVGMSVFLSGALGLLVGVVVVALFFTAFIAVITAPMLPAP